MFCCGYLTWSPNGNQGTRKVTFSVGKGQIKEEKIIDYRWNKRRILGAERLKLGEACKCNDKQFL